MPSAYYDDEDDGTYSNESSGVAQVDAEPTWDRVPQARHVQAVSLALADQISRAAIRVSADQQQAMLRIVSLAYFDWRDRADGVWVPRRYMTLTGPAGSGKTTVTRVIVEALRTLGFDVSLGAPTGKAAARIRQVFPGVHAATIHGLIYGSPEEHGICPKCRVGSSVLARAVADLQAAGVERRCPSCKTLVPPDALVESKLSFAMVDRSGLEAGDVWIIDEASMVTAQQHADLMAQTRHGGLILYVGDPNQLEPVEEAEEAKRPHPNFTVPTGALSMVHRQGEGSGILKAASAVLNGVTDGLIQWQGYSDFRATRGGIDRLIEQTATAVRYDRDQITLVASNRRRVQINQGVADAMARWVPTIGVTPFRMGQRFQCALNNHLWGVMNGEILRVVDARPVPMDPEIFEVRLTGAASPCEWFYVIPSVVDGQTRDYRWMVRQHTKRFDALSKEWTGAGKVTNPDGVEDGRPVGPFQDYLQAASAIDTSRCLHVNLGYAITVHKSQGSQWDRVIYVWDGTVWGMHFRKNLRRHLYTGITRAQRHAELYLLPKDN